MKYPFIIFYRLEKYSDVDQQFILNNDKLDCSIFFTSDMNDLNRLFDFNYQILITYGPDESEYIDNCLSIIAQRMRNRWVHLKEIPDFEIFNRMINNCMIYNCIYERESVRPVFSAFSPTYNSYDKIFRAYNSLKSQTLIDWEWVILDDSPDDEHFNFLREQFLNDRRVRLYRKGENSGSIGNVKNEAASLCRGKYVLELDHDDVILPHVLKDAVNVFEKDSEVGFIYMDCACVYENGNNHSFGDFICKGYGGYYCQRYGNGWINVYITPNINNITLSHLVCCPNHPRIWRKQTLLDLGNYSEFLPICDDYEIILRTALNTKMAKIHKLGYIQYMNNENNNFSLIRNGEINRIGPLFISPMFYQNFKIHDKMRDFDAYEDEKYMNEHSQIWKRGDSYEYKYCNKIVNVDFEKQFCIIGIDSLIFNLERIKDLYNDPLNDFIILDNKCHVDYLCNKLDNYGFHRFKCYSLVDTTEAELEKYFHLLYKSCDNFEIINDNIVKLNYNTSFYERFLVINAKTKPTDNYIEIGVENGFTFNKVHFINKIGVDPDPKCNNDTIVPITSDAFFEGFININGRLDGRTNVIFIDGLHQAEQVVKDINNSIKCLVSDDNIEDKGKLFIDDVLPLTYDEQLKIPNKHFYENDILKYGEPWTGDVWKVVYYVLQHFADCLDFAYFYHINYRGVAMLTIKKMFQIEHEAIDIINNYSYREDFPNYIELIKNFDNKKLSVTRIPIEIISEDEIDNDVDIINTNINDTNYVSDKDSDDE